ncbi:ABC transporter permease [Clostridium beijerinckii]|uniref:ABC transporter permease n=1 Tax=Clostridium beijerinckii TaxID=1520 RepID=A0A7X9SSL8_CLOBE|nr:ABC transporter permease [Clostridium beijerinckii]NMF07342.1 ABC transporter permease [Clostridium beijerinckii]
MTFSIRRVSALTKKEVKNLSKNINILVLCAIPLIFCFVYSNAFSESQEIKMAVFNHLLNINFTIISGTLIAMLIAEEKEKNTLRTLMLAGVSPLEFLSGKAIIAFLISIVTNILMFFIIGMDISCLGQFILITTLATVSMIEFGAAIGLIAENQMSTGTIGTPLFLLISLIPSFSKYNNIFQEVAKLLPSYNMDVLLNRIFYNEAININFAYNISVILIWIIIGTGIFAYIYGKKKLD